MLIFLDTSTILEPGSASRAAILRPRIARKPSVRAGIGLDVSSVVGAGLGAGVRLETDPRTDTPQPPTVQPRTRSDNRVGAPTNPLRGFPPGKHPRRGGCRV
jgi:hypothetical protein